MGVVSGAHPVPASIPLPRPQGHPPAAATASAGRCHAAMKRAAALTQPGGPAAGDCPGRADIELFGRVPGRPMAAYGRFGVRRRGEALCTPALAPRSAAPSAPQRPLPPSTLGRDGHASPSAEPGRANLVRRDAEQDYESDPEHPYAVGPPPRPARPGPALGPGRGSSCFGVASHASCSSGRACEAGTTLLRSQGRAARHSDDSRSRYRRTVSGRFVDGRRRRESG